jgi:hypothetical protein
VREAVFSIPPWREISGMTLTMMLTSQASQQS